MLDEQYQHKAIANEHVIGEKHWSGTERSKASRVTKPPTWLKDYVTGKKSSTYWKHPITNHVSYNYLSEAYQSYVGLVSTSTETRNFKEDISR